MSGYVDPPVNGGGNLSDRYEWDRMRREAMGVAQGVTFSRFGRVSSRMLIQELAPTWFHVLVGCILCNRTDRVMSHPAMWKILERYQRPYDLSMASPRKLSQILAPCGLQNRRARSIIALADAWPKFHVGRDDVRSLPGVGDYAADAWRIVCECDWSVEPEDVELAGLMEEYRRDFACNRALGSTGALTCYLPEDHESRFGLGHVYLPA